MCKLTLSSPPPPPSSPSPQISYQELRNILRDHGSTFELETICAAFEQCSASSATDMASDAMVDYGRFLLFLRDFEPSFHRPIDAGPAGPSAATALADTTTTTTTMMTTVEPCSRGSPRSPGSPGSPGSAASASAAWRRPGTAGSEPGSPGSERSTSSRRGKLDKLNSSYWVKPVVVWANPAVAGMFQE